MKMEVGLHDTESIVDIEHRTMGLVFLVLVSSLQEGCYRHIGSKPKVPFWGWIMY